MKQAIAGVTPSQTREVTVMTIWPSIAANGIGRFLGTLFEIKLGFYIFTVGNLMALAAIPVALVLYLMRIAPFTATRYRLTNRRVMVERGLSNIESNSVGLDRFDTIDVEVGPGQAWYHAGDLIFRQGEVERIRLDGVSRPESFRQICLNSQRAYVGVQAAMEREAAHV